MNDKKTILFFDGVCNLCNGFVRFVFHRDKHKRFHFQSLQSNQAQETLKTHNYLISNQEDFKSFVLLYDNKIYTKSSAALKVFSLLGFPYSFMNIFYIVPKFLRDTVYSFIARNRYKWFGKQKEVCEYNPAFRQRVL